MRTTVLRNNADEAQAVDDVDPPANFSQDNSATMADQIRASQPTANAELPSPNDKQNGAKLQSAEHRVDDAKAALPRQHRTATQHAKQSKQKATARKQSSAHDIDAVQQAIKGLILQSSPDVQKRQAQDVAANPSSLPRKPAAKSSRGQWTEPPKGHQKPNKKAPLVEESSSSGGWDRGEVAFKTGHLGDWSGGLGPPILDWDYLPPFRNGQCEENVERWLDSVEAEHASVEREIRMSDYRRYVLTPEAARPVTFDQDFWTRTIVPDYWLPLNVGNQSAALFWRESKLSVDPGPLDDGDLDEVEPWWIEFPPHQSPFQQTYQQPHIGRIDPDETREQREARARDRGSEEAAILYNRKKQQKSAKHHKYPRHDTFANGHPSADDVQNSRLFKPSIKLLIRPAIRDDMLHIAELYNRYIHFAVSAAEEEHFTEENMKERWRACQAQQLPMLVACEPSYSIKPSRRHRNDYPIRTPEKVIGFAYARNYELAGFVCQESKYAQVITRDQYYMKGVGTCLLDKIIKALNFAHKDITTCEADIPPLPQDKTGQSVNIRNILVHFLWDQTQPEKLEWIGSWLSNKFGFKQCATINKVASKLDKEVNLTIFQKTIC